MKRLCALLCLFLAPHLLQAGTGVNNEEWPHWRGVHHDGTAISDSFELGQGKGFKIAWKKELGSGYSSISIADGRAITMFSDGKNDVLIALDAKTGKELWRYDIAETYKAPVNSFDGTLSTAAINDGLVYGVGPKGHLFAVDVTNGHEEWKTSLADFGSAEPHFGWTTSPLVSGNLLVVQTGAEDNKTVTGFDKKSGKVLWSTGDDVINYQSPALIEIHGANQVVCTGNAVALGLDPQTGGKLWELKHEGGMDSAHPVPAGTNRVYLRHRGREGMLIEISKDDQGFSAQELWKSAEIKETTNPSVFLDDRLYGFSRGFLTAVDATNGDRLWRSRQPGEGYTIMVNDYLVTLTRRGTLHAAKAGQDAYVDAANLEVFDHITWSPPSFAYGNVYVRSLREIACIEVVGIEQAIQLEKPAVTGMLPDSEFAAFVKKVEAASDKGALIDEFLAQQTSFPVIEAGKMAHVVYRGEVEDLAISGDMIESGQSLPFNRIAETDFYYYSFELDNDAFISYGLVIDFEEASADPRNPAKAPSFGNDLSALAMPGFSDGSHLAELESFEFASKILDNKRQIRVYLPAGYHSGEARYPVVYVNYGAQAPEKGLLHRTLANLAGRTVEPTIAVFVHLNVEMGYEELGADSQDGYAEMMTQELVPMIDAKYRTQSKPEARALVGVSSGGYISVFTAFKHSGVFGFVGAQSCNLSGPRRDGIAEIIAETDKVPTLFFIQWGKYDQRADGGTIDFAKLGRDLWENLSEKGYEVRGGEMKLGYGWASWRTVNDTMMETFFPIE